MKVSGGILCAFQEARLRAIPLPELQMDDDLAAIEPGVIALGMFPGSSSDEYYSRRECRSLTRSTIASTIEIPKGVALFN